MILLENRFKILKSCLKMWKFWEIKRVDMVIIYCCKEVDC